MATLAFQFQIITPVIAQGPFMEETVKIIQTTAGQIPAKMAALVCKQILATRVTFAYVPTGPVVKPVKMPRFCLLLIASTCHLPSYVIMK
jgi:hypothetical protein